MAIRSFPKPFLSVIALLFLLFCPYLSPLNNRNLTSHFLFINTISLTQNKTSPKVVNSLVAPPSPSPSPSSPKHEEINTLGRIEGGLAAAREAIKKAVQSHNYTLFKEETYIPRGSIYINPYAFHQSHIEMEKRFKVWIYKEGERPLFHHGPLKNIYGIEGHFIGEMETSNSHFIAGHPDEAHAFLIPISVAHIVKFLYRPLVTYSRAPIHNLVQDYVQLVARKYPYWNRSSGGDHFLVSCHDWAPDVSDANPKLFKNLIRVLCNANYSEKYDPHKDVSMPEINVPPDRLVPPVQDLPPNKRSIFAFFAGGRHGHIRHILLDQWKDKDHEVQVHQYLKGKQDYLESMGRSKYCLCPSGYEVASPRLVTALYVGCVPVIISDYYKLPFSDVLDWSKFSVHIPSQKIPEIRSILENISNQTYLELRENGRMATRHFVLNRPTQPYDVIDMILHSVWLRRLDLKLLF